MDEQQKIKTPEQIAQWVIDNRHSKGEGRTTPDFEVFHQVKDDINALINRKDKELSKERDANHFAENSLGNAINAWRDQCDNLKLELEKTSKSAKHWLKEHDNLVENTKIIVAKKDKEISELKEQLSQVK